MNPGMCFITGSVIYNFELVEHTGLFFAFLRLGYVFGNDRLRNGKSAAIGYLYLCRSKIRRMLDAKMHWVKLVDHPLLADEVNTLIKRRLGNTS